uniref:Uncharacterized protein n=1 Tax=Panagrolaimus sp. ES5 TaxID=591445 RepID=A0AC34FWM2_9BILA
MKFGCISSLFVLIILVLHFYGSDAVSCVDLQMKGSEAQIIRIMQNLSVVHDINGEPGFEFKGSFLKNCSDACVIYICERNSEEFYFGLGCPNDFYNSCKLFTEEVKEVQDSGPNNLDYHNDKFTVYYSSGCGSEINGTECIFEKFLNYYDKTVEELASRTTPAPTPPPPSGSNNQNDAMKFIGFIIFGWIFAFWNL